MPIYISSRYIFLFLYLLTILINLIIHLIKRKPITLYYLILSITIPYLGFIYPIFTKAISVLTKDSDSILESYENYIKKDVKWIKYRNFEKEKDANLVPIEEALLINENNIKRDLLINLLKGDSKEYIDALKLAITDEDTETSHYAAAAIMEVTSSFETLCQKYAVLYHKDKKNKNILLPYENVLKKYINSSLLNGKSFLKYKNIYKDVLINIVNFHPEYEEYHKSLIDCEIELGNYVEAEQYCLNYKRIFTDSEGPYLALLKMYYHIWDKNNFNITLTELKESNISLSADGLNIVRFWLAQK